MSFGRIFFTLFLGLLFLSARAQDEDSIFLNSDQKISFFSDVETPDPNRAAMLSAVLPGLGQAYNKQYWKIPLIYGGGIIMAHFIDYNHRIYNSFRSSLVALVDDRPETVNPYDAVTPGLYAQSTITRNRDAFRRNRDYLMIWAGVLYLLNIAEAHIAAHLKEFDLNESLSMQVGPTFQQTAMMNPTVSIGITLTF